MVEPLLRGWLGEYWAQGMDEVWSIFQDRRHARDREGGWELAGTYRLAQGDRLTLFGEDGDVLWSGEIRGRRAGLLGRRRLHPHHPAWSPAGIETARWQGWLRHDPPLNALLRRPGEGASGAGER